MDNSQRLRDALALALADDDFMGNSTKVRKAVEALTPKSTVTATFKRLQGNALGDYALKKENGVAGYNNETKAQKVKEYVHDRFKSYMVDPRTSVEATKLFNAAYPEPVPQSDGQGHAA
ncbi:hypothetical protein GMST_42600 [Geomonas silvestris]|uniref:Uncharacterized protein n=1 Tax=Geomonas silvestris TaxID=2740184 RepID=A0A6V8MPF1_9BACT|nr:hypothetical protein [Geomonas silvestris]GFO61935.1 hypothetical protein GMST_42600 [Geomonas silvestris]